MYENKQRTNAPAMPMTGVLESQPTLEHLLTRIREDAVPGGEHAVNGVAIRTGSMLARVRRLRTRSGSRRKDERARHFLFHRRPGGRSRQYRVPGGNHRPLLAEIRLRQSATEGSLPVATRGGRCRA